MLRDATADDASGVCRIYNHYVRNTTVTFEETDVSEEEMGRRISEANHPWIVCVEEGRLLGYAHASGWRAKSAYNRTVESTVYVDPEETGKGVGGRLYEELLGRLRASGAHAVVGVIALPNDASVALHEKLGFENVARLREVGFKFGKWIDVGYWELVFSDGDDPA